MLGQRRTPDGPLAPNTGDKSGSITHKLHSKLQEPQATSHARRAAREKRDQRTRIGKGDDLHLVGVQPHLALAAAQHRRGQPLLQLQGRHGSEKCRQQQGFGTRSGRGCHARGDSTNPSTRALVNGVGQCDRGGRPRRGVQRRPRAGSRQHSGGYLRKDTLSIIVTGSLC